MSVFLPILLFAVGVLFVIKGGDCFVDAASWIAEVSGIPKLIVGATIVSVATTLPEMFVSVMAATQGKVDMSIGNAVGSVTANIGLIMAIALICMPGVIKRKDYLVKSILMLLAALIIVLCGFRGEANIAFSIVLLVIFAVFLWDNIAEARKTMKGAQDEPTDTAAKPAEKAQRDRRTVVTNIVKFVIGAVGIVLGAELLVDNGSELALMMGVSERIIGVTLVAVGTSLPELITTITAIAKKQTSLSAGNILGANILDLTLIMPLASLISGQSLPVSHTAALIDLPMCLLVGVIAIIPAVTQAKFSRWQGIVLLGVYASYIVVTCII